MSGFNINEIKSHLTFGGARQNLFQVSITNPTDRASTLVTPFFVQSASIPAADVGTIEVPYFGRKLKLAGDRTFPAWTVNVINDEDFLIRNAMEQWSNRINGLESNIRTIGGEYKSEATVTQYSKGGSALRNYGFHNLFPTDISPIELDWGTNDQYETFQVTFQYDYWTVTGGVTGTPGT